MPDFVKKDVSIWFTIDNIDVLEDTPSGQGIFHGTVIVVFQRAIPGDRVNPPLIIKQHNKDKPRYYLNIDYLQAPAIKFSPVRFKTFKLHQPSELSTCTGVWQLCSHVSNHLSYYIGFNLEEQPDKEEPYIMPTSDGTKSLILQKMKWINASQTLKFLRLF